VAPIVPGPEPYEPSAQPPPPPEAPAGGVSIGNRTFSPLFLAAVAFAFLVLFGCSAFAVPALLSSGPSASPVATGTPIQAAPPPADSATPSAEPTTDAPSPTASAKASASAPTGVTGNSGFEDQVLTLVNNERRAARCDPVRMDSKLRTAARAHSTDMAAKNFLDHDGSDDSDPEDRMRAAGYPNPLDEVIARGGSPQDVVRAWTRDRSDHKVLVDCDAKAIGVGYEQKNRTGYWTLDTGK
jgi:uncharacterized protein YkwD